MPDSLELQIKISRMLACGFVLTLLGIGGIGSFIAFIVGLRARRIIRRSRSAVVGAGLAWWCIIVGGAQSIILPLKILSTITGSTR